MTLSEDEFAEMQRKVVDGVGAWYRAAARAFFGKKPIECTPEETREMALMLRASLERGKTRQSRSHAAKVILQALGCGCGIESVKYANDLKGRQDFGTARITHRPKCGSRT